MMGGSRIKKNMVGENASILLVSCSGRVIMIMPTTAPRNTENKIFNSNYKLGIFKLICHYPLLRILEDSEISLLKASEAEKYSK